MLSEKTLRENSLCWNWRERVVEKNTRYVSREKQKELVSNELKIHLRNSISSMSHLFHVRHHLIRSFDGNETSFFSRSCSMSIVIPLSEFFSSFLCLLLPSLWYREKERVRDIRSLSSILSFRHHPCVNNQVTLSPFCILLQGSKSHEVISWGTFSSFFRQWENCLLSSLPSTSSLSLNLLLPSQPSSSTASRQSDSNVGMYLIPSQRFFLGSLRREIRQKSLLHAISLFCTFSFKKGKGKRERKGRQGNKKYLEAMFHRVSKQFPP